MSKDGFNSSHFIHHSGHLKSIMHCIWCLYIFSQCWKEREREAKEANSKSGKWWKENRSCKLVLKLRIYCCWHCGGEGHGCQVTIVVGWFFGKMNWGYAQLTTFWFPVNQKSCMYKDLAPHFRFEPVGKQQMRDPCITCQQSHSDKPFEKTHWSAKVLQMGKGLPGPQIPASSKSCVQDVGQFTTSVIWKTDLWKASKQPGHQKWNALAKCETWYYLVVCCAVDSNSRRSFKSAFEIQGDTGEPP
jgi:hypothetical protein